MARLGEIERPPVERFTGKKKLYCVPNVYPLRDAPEGYKELLRRYWDDVIQQIERLEAAGKVKKLFCESIYTRGEEALRVLARINEDACRVVRRKVEEGALFMPLEDREVFGPFIDWKSCLSVVKTPEVSARVLEFYTEVYEKRLQRIRETIEANISEGEAGLLIMADEDRVRLRLSPDIEIFLVIPPSYDDILKWLRDRMREAAAT